LFDWLCFLLVFVFLFWQFKDAKSILLKTKEKKMLKSMNTCYIGEVMDWCGHECWNLHTFCMGQCSTCIFWLDMLANSYLAFETILSYLYLILIYIAWIFDETFGIYLSINLKIYIQFLVLAKQISNKNHPIGTTIIWQYFGLQKSINSIFEMLGNLNHSIS
jgi:hypothetical protein